MIHDIKSQTYKDWELIIVSNGPGQEAQLNVIHPFVKEDERIRLIEVIEGGVSNARNIGLNAVTGKWIAFVDADDRCTTDHLERLASVADEGVDMVVGGYTHCNVLKHTESEEKVPEFDKLSDFIKRPQVLTRSLCCKLFATDLIKKSGIKFDTSLAYCEDGIYVFSLLEKTDKVKSIEMTGYRYMCRSEVSACSTYQPSFYKASDLLLDKIYELFIKFGMPKDDADDLIAYWRYLDLYFGVCNLFRRNCTLSLNSKRKFIKKHVYSSPYRNYNKGTGIHIKTFRTCIKTGSPLFMTLVFGALFKMRNLIVKIKRS